MTQNWEKGSTSQCDFDPTEDFVEIYS